MLHIKATPTKRFNRQATIETQHHYLHQAPTQIPECQLRRSIDATIQKESENTFKE